MDIVARCLDCGWEGSLAEGGDHDDDAHLVVYNAREPTLMERLEAEYDEEDILPCGCGH